MQAEKRTGPLVVEAAFVDPAAGLEAPQAAVGRMSPAVVSNRAAHRGIRDRVMPTMLARCDDEPARR
jgi:hypothetical protein